MHCTHPINDIGKSSMTAAIKKTAFCWVSTVAEYIELIRNGEMKLQRFKMLDTTANTTPVYDI